MSADNHGGFVYFIRAGYEGPVKIGYAKDVERRLGSLRSGNPRPLRVVVTIPGNQPMERMIHREAKKHRLNGEWFEMCSAFVDRVEKVCGKLPALRADLHGIPPEFFEESTNPKVIEVVRHFLVNRD